MDTNALNNFFEDSTPAQLNGLEPSPHLQAAMQDGSVAVAPIEESEITPEVVETQDLSLRPSNEVVVEETPQQLRFRELREAKMKADWERDQLAKELAQLKAAQQYAPIEDDEDDNFGIGSEDIIEGKHLAKIVKAVEKKVEKKISRQFAQQQAKTQAELIDQRLRMEHPDIDHVLSYASVLAAQEPELAKSLLANTDTYSQLKATYKMIKKLGIAPDKDAVNKTASEKQRIAQNLAKPRAVQSVAPRQSGLTEVSSYDNRNLTQEQKNQIWAEMQSAIRNG